MSSLAFTSDYFESSQVACGWRPSNVPAALNTGTKHFPPAKLRVPKSEFVLGAHRIVSSKPVQVTVYEDEDCFVACNETLQIWAAEDSAQSAMQDFTEQLVHFFLHYQGKPADAVTGLAAKLKEIYAANFQEV